MKYKLVVVDMDGTCLNSNKEISLQNKKTITAALDQGVVFAIATGRLYKAIRVYAKELGLKAPIISCNGSFVKGVYDTEPLFSEPLSSEIIHGVAEVCKRHEVDFCLYSEDTVIGERATYKLSFLSKWNQTLKPEDRVNLEVVSDYRSVLPVMDVYKIIASTDDTSRLLALAADLNILPHTEALRSDFQSLDIGRVGVSKGTAVKALAESLSIHQEEVVAIGDNENDLEMIRYAGLGVAMANASDVIINAADYITETNDNDGVAAVLHKFILK